MKTWENKYGTNNNYTIDNCNFRNINAKFGAMALGCENGYVNVTNCIIENVTGSVSAQSEMIIINGANTVNMDNIIIRNCSLNKNVATESATSTLRAIIKVDNTESTVKLSNSIITDNYGPISFGHNFKHFLRAFDFKAEQMELYHLSWS